MYQVLARKWRPQLFEEVVGQNHVVRTLKNAISLGRIAHAYLFTGPWGTGKTSTARILAKALNCQKGPTTSPCNGCSECREIIRGESLDVLEIDGATNRGIDEVRDLREKARFSPIKGKFKVYIIDEVHMLTTPAFNALLKTLEEPPPHVVFILVTTNPHKLPLTIISRCQRFDFRKISTPDIFARLQQIVEKEGIAISKEALYLIAEGGENSMRDAEVILDQAVSYAEGEIKEKDVTDILGMVEKIYLFELTENVARKDPLSNISLLNRLLEEGKTPEWLIKGWRRWFRNLIITKMGGEREGLFSLAPSEREEAKKQASYFGLRQLLYFMEILSQTRRKMVFSSQPQIHLELLMVQLSSPEFEVDELSLKEPKLAAIYQRIVDLEEKLIKSSTGGGKLKEGASEEGKDKQFLGKWSLMIREIEDRKKSLGTLLQRAKITTVEEDSATLELENKFQEEILKKKENQSLIKEVLRKFLSPHFNLHYVLANSLSSSRLGKVVAKTMDLFQGEIVEDMTRR